MLLRAEPNVSTGRDVDREIDIDTQKVNPPWSFIIYAIGVLESRIFGSSRGCGKLRGDLPAGLGLRTPWAPMFVADSLPM